MPFPLFSGQCKINVLPIHIYMCVYVWGERERLIQKKHGSINYVLPIHLYMQICILYTYSHPLFSRHNIFTHSSALSDLMNPFTQDLFANISSVHCYKTQMSENRATEDELVFLECFKTSS